MIGSAGNIFAEKTGDVYQSTEFGYTITLPNGWAQMPDSRVQEYFPDYPYEVVGFYTQDGEEISPFMFITQDKQGGELYQLTEDYFYQYNLDPKKAEAELKQLTQDMYADRLVSINSIEFDSTNHRIYQNKTITDGNVQLIQVTINILTKQSILTLDVFLDPDADAVANQVLVNSIVNSVEHDSYVAPGNKVIAMRTGKAFDDKTNTLQNPTFMFNRNNDDQIIMYVRFADYTTEEVTVKWYHYGKDNTKNLFFEYTQEEGYPAYIFGISKKFGPISSGKYDVELTTGDIKETVSFVVVSEGNMKPANIQINGIQKVFDTYPVNINGRNLVPLRGIFEALGATIEWDNDTQTVTAVKGKTTIVLKLGDQYAYINGEKVLLEVKAQSINGRTMVPLRFVGEALGAEVLWDGATQTVDINSK